MRIPLSKSLYMSAAAFAVLSTSGAAVPSTYKVTVQDNGQRKIVRGFGPKTVGNILLQEGVNSDQNVIVSPKPSTPIQDGMTIAFWTKRTIQLVDGGKTAEFDTYASTIGAFLQGQEIKLQPTDSINLPLDYPLTEGQKIIITRRQTSVSSYFQQIPYHTIYRYTNTLYKGQTRVLEHGINGKLKVTRTSHYMNGHRVQTVVQKNVALKVQNRVVEIGTRRHETQLSSRSDSIGPNMQALTVVSTAYTAGGRTATGWSAQPGVVAVDPSVIPLGTKLYIPGMGVVYAEDTGGAIVGNRIDICMTSESDAVSWGVRTIVIYILK